MKHCVYLRPSFFMRSYIFLATILFSMNNSSFGAVATMPPKLLAPCITASQTPWYTPRIEPLIGLATDISLWPNRLFDAVNQLKDAQRNQNLHHSCQKIIVFGPYGCGKTTLAQKIAAETNSTLLELSDPLSNTQKTSALFASAQEITQSGKTVVIHITHIQRLQTEPFPLKNNCDDENLSAALVYAQEKLAIRMKFWESLESIQKNSRIMVILEAESMDDLGDGFIYKLNAYPIEELNLPSENARFELAKDLWKKLFHNHFKKISSDAKTLDHQDAFFKQIATASNGLSCEAIKNEFNDAYLITKEAFPSFEENAQNIEAKTFLKEFKKNYQEIIAKRQLLFGVTLSAKIRAQLTNLLATLPSEKQFTSFLLGVSSTLFLINYSGKPEKDAQDPLEKNQEQEKPAPEAALLV